MSVVFINFSSLSRMASILDSRLRPDFCPLNDNFYRINSCNSFYASVVNKMKQLKSSYRGKHLKKVYIKNFGSVVL